MVVYEVNCSVRLKTAQSQLDAKSACSEFLSLETKKPISIVHIIVFIICMHVGPHALGCR